MSTTGAHSDNRTTGSHDRGGGGPAIVHARGLAFRYAGADRDALAGVDLDVAAGGALGLMGLNGAGKTTLIKLLCGVLEPTGGRLEVLGSPRISRSPAAKARLGVMHQKMTFDMMLPALDNLKINASLHGRNWRTVRTRALDLCAAFELTGDVLAQTTYTLSGGQMRRLQLVRALLLEPDLLIVDEPTTGLDLLARKALWSALRDLRADGTALLVCSHHPDEIEALCDRLLILHHGRGAAHGTLDEVCARHAGTPGAALEDAFTAAVGRPRELREPREPHEEGTA